MYEDYYGLAEKPFSLTPDPKFLYRSEPHTNAFDLLKYAVRRREGFVVITGDIGTGKTTLCRALLAQINRRTFTALVLDPFLSEEDLLKRILLDFGVVSRDELKAGSLAGVTKHELIDTLYDFLLGLIPLNASAVLIIDEAQNLPLPILEQIRMLSNLETDKEKLLQIILVGQLNLQDVLRLPSMRQLDQRVSIRYELKALDQEAVGTYVTHRLTVAGGSESVAFTAKALDEVYRRSGGIPRVINLICDRALLKGFSARARRITPEMVVEAAQSLDVARPRLRSAWTWRARPLLASAALMLLVAAGAVGATTYFDGRFGLGRLQASSRQPDTDRPLTQAELPGRRLPDGAAATILAGTFVVSDPAAPAAIRALTDELEAAGHRVYYAQVDLGWRGRWQHVLAGAYPDSAAAQRDARQMNEVRPAFGARAVTAAFATGTVR